MSASSEKARAFFVAHGSSSSPPAIRTVSSPHMTETIRTACALLRRLMCPCGTRHRTLLFASHLRAISSAHMPSCGMCCRVLATAPCARVPRLVRGARVWFCALLRCRLIVGSRLYVDGKCECWRQAPVHTITGPGKPISFVFGHLFCYLCRSSPLPVALRSSLALCLTSCDFHCHSLGFYAAFARAVLSHSLVRVGHGCDSAPIVARCRMTSRCAAVR